MGGEGEVSVIKGYREKGTHQVFAAEFESEKRCIHHHNNAIIDILLKKTNNFE